MNMDELTLGQIKQIQNLLGAASATKKAHPFVGRYVLCRCYAAGVHVGILSDIDGENVILLDSRRLWSWKSANGVALSGVAQFGLNSGKVDVVNPEISLTGVCEIIPMSAAAEASVRGQK